MTPGYRALHEAAAWIDLAGRGWIAVRGPEAADFLHRITTVDVKALKPYQGAYAFFLNPRGGILADVVVYRLADGCRLDTAQELRGKVWDLLHQYLFLEEVELEDCSPASFVLGLEGPLASSLLERAGLPVPQQPWSVAMTGELLVARVSATGQPGWRIYGPLAQAQPVREALERAGAVAATSQDIEVVRLENGRPLYGVDFDERSLPQETGLMHAVHFGKGCYPGQETVERIRSRGHVNRLLVPLTIRCTTPPDPGAPVLVQGKAVGEITSAAWSPRHQGVVALAYLRTSVLAGEEPITVHDAVARVTALTPHQGP